MSTLTLQGVQTRMDNAERVIRERYREHKKRMRKQAKHDARIRRRRQLQPPSKGPTNKPSSATRRPQPRPQLQPSICAPFIPYWGPRPLHSWLGRRSISLRRSAEPNDSTKWAAEQARLLLADALCCPAKLALRRQVHIVQVKTIKADELRQQADVELQQLIAAQAQEQLQSSSLSSNVSSSVLDSYQHTDDEPHPLRRMLSCAGELLDAQDYAVYLRTTMPPSGWRL